MDKIGVIVYKSICAGLFSKAECDEDNLTLIEVEKDALRDWIKTDWRVSANSIEEFIDTYTADMSVNLVYWLIDKGYGLRVPGKEMYRYGMRLRPFSIGCQPKEGLLWRETDQSGQYYDIIVYSRPLAEEEISQYSLSKIGKE